MDHHFDTNVKFNAVIRKFASSIVPHLQADIVMA